MIEYYNKKQKQKELKERNKDLKKITNTQSNKKNSQQEVEEDESTFIHRKLEALKDNVLIFPKIVVDEYVKRLISTERKNKAAKNYSI